MRKLLVVIATLGLTFGFANASFASNGQFLLGATVGTSPLKDYMLTKRPATMGANIEYREGNIGLKASATTASGEESKYYGYGVSSDIFAKIENFKIQLMGYHDLGKAKAYAGIGFGSSKVHFNYSCDWGYFGGFSNSLEVTKTGLAYSFGLEIPVSEKVSFQIDASNLPGIEKMNVLSIGVQVNI